MASNVVRLIARRASQLMVPPGGGLKEAMVALSSPESLQDIGKEAREWVEAAIAVVKTAPDNPFGNDDEAIAEEILRRIDEKSPFTSDQT